MERKNKEEVKCLLTSPLKSASRSILYKNVLDFIIFLIKCKYLSSIIL